jgi:HEPN domain-containing protein
LTLYQRFFEAAKLDMASAKILTEKDLYQPAIYHLQQAYEKCIKSLFACEFVPGFVNTSTM